MRNGRRVLCGIDEAGYGPTLGPLVIARVAVAAADHRSVDRAFRAAGTGVADSKRVHTAGALGPLEAVALAGYRWLTGSVPADATALAPEAEPAPPWLARAADCTLPLARQEPTAWRLPDLEPVALRIVVVQPRELNRARLAGRNKAALELEIVVGLLRELWGDAASSDAIVDRLGGRRYYGPALAAGRTGMEMTVERETKDESRYRLFAAGREHLVRFRVGGEAASPLVALASCVAKYVREVQMHLFNRYWCARRPDLAPTAGYPADAKRWLAALGDATVARHGEELVRGWEGPDLWSAGP